MADVSVLDASGNASSSASTTSYTAELLVHGISYILTVSIVGDELLLIECEDKASCDRWKGEFSSRYTEEITQRTGSMKKFGTFVKMLLTAMQGRSESVFVDLLTFADLEELKNRRSTPSSDPNAAGADSPLNNSARSISSAATAARMQNKRYLILTYVVEFDRVHYPLPLSFEENPDPQLLKGIIQRLRSENAELKQQLSSSSTASSSSKKGSNISEKQQLTMIESLKKEVDVLKVKLRKAMESSSAVGQGEEQLLLRMERLQAEKKEAEDALERIKRENSREMKRIQRECEELSAELETQSSQMEVLRRKFLDAAGDKSAEKQLRKQLVRIQEDLEAERAASRKAAAKVRKELDALNSEAQKAKDLEKMYRIRCRELAAELDAARRRTPSAVTARSAYGSGYNSSSNQSTPTKPGRPPLPGRPQSAPQRRSPSPGLNTSNSSVRRDPSPSSSSINAGGSRSRSASPRSYAPNPVPSASSPMRRNTPPISGRSASAASSLRSTPNSSIESHKSSFSSSMAPPSASPSRSRPSVVPASSSARPPLGRSAGLSDRSPSPRNASSSSLVGSASPSSSKNSSRPVASSARGNNNHAFSSSGFSSESEAESISSSSKRTTPTKKSGLSSSILSHSKASVVNQGPQPGSSRRKLALYSSEEREQEEDQQEQYMMMSARPQRRRHSDEAEDEEEEEEDQLAVKQSFRKQHRVFEDDEEDDELERKIVVTRVASSKNAALQSSSRTKSGDAAAVPASGRMNASAELSEIDARLHALQDFLMRKNNGRK